MLGIILALFFFSASWLLLLMSKKLTLICARGISCAPAYIYPVVVLNNYAIIMQVNVHTEDAINSLLVFGRKYFRDIYIAAYTGNAALKV